MKRDLALKASEKIGEKVLVSGWASNLRDHGSLIFIDMRDWSGIIQLTIDEKYKDAFETAKKVGLEFVIQAIGKVVNREESVINPNIPTGKVEIVVEELTILNKCKNLPFPLDDDGRNIDENLRLKYRYIDIRRKRIRDLIQLRHQFIQYTRNWFDQHGFTHVDTPLLTVSSPEGARDFLVPSRIYPGKFFALPQAPQQYKQLLMVGGVDKYFQIAPCMRDEDPRADRHSGAFYQLDVECSFIDQQSFFEEVEPYFKDVVNDMTNKKLLEYPFRQIPYEESMDRYGSDKPDIRFGMELFDLTEEFNNSGLDIFKTVNCVKAIFVPREFSRKEIDELTEKVKLQGAKGLAWLKYDEGKLDSSLVKFFDEKLQKAISDKVASNTPDAKNGMIFAIAGEKIHTQKQTGWLRLQMGDLLQLRDPNLLAFCWIVNFPIYEFDDKTGKWDFGHNPFTMPQGGMDSLKNKPMGEIYGTQYDIACNGYEIASGSIRNHDPEILIEAFRLIGVDEEETRKRYNHIISAFEFGAPPHGGFAPGIDRLMMIFFDESNIREVYAFPQTNGQELMTGAPREITNEDLKLYGLKHDDMGNEICEQIKAILDSKKITYELTEHKEAKTSEEAAKIRGISLDMGAKTVVMRSKIYPSKMIMAVVPADKHVDIEAFQESINHEVEVAPAELVEKRTGLKVGAIPPFGRLLGMDVYFDKAIYSKDKMVFSAGRRDKSILIDAKDLIAACEPDIISSDLDISR
ncbi:MAG TPA: aspartate--tRNA ligase [Candidatus Dojkabacteria bacterium]|nr:aspartate--tRNA ligase [Candidatus Dojkabacteria bacterium]